MDATCRWGWFMPSALPVLIIQTLTQNEYINIYACCCNVHTICLNSNKLSVSINCMLIVQPLALHLQYNWMRFTWGHIILITCHHSGAGVPWRGLTVQWQLPVLWGQTQAAWIPTGPAHRLRIRCSTGHGRPVSWQRLHPSACPFSPCQRHFTRCSASRWKATSDELWAHTEVQSSLLIKESFSWLASIVTSHWFLWLFYDCVR